jgi:peptidoglycan/xylan/chitin deacetylase (PgdA/CDA1 family)
VDRRSFIATLASGIALAAVGGAAAYAAGANGIEPRDLLSGRWPGTPTSPRLTAPTLLYPDGRPVPTELPPPTSVYGRFAVPRLAKIPVPGGEISALPGAGNMVALTVDDGASSETIKGYCDFVELTGFRLTFFITSQYDGWDSNLKQLRRLVDSGNVQVANHTVTHKSLIRCSDETIADELAGCERYITNNFGRSAHPYFRPPYGDIDDRVAHVAAGMGYSTPVMWYGSFGDSGKTSVGGVKMMAKRWLLPQHIVIGHANHTPVLGAMDYIQEVMHARQLQPVTLDDVYSR